MIDRVMHAAQLKELLFFYLEYLTPLMCFGIRNYNHFSVVKKFCRKTLRILWLKPHIFGFFVLPNISIFALAHFFPQSPSQTLITVLFQQTAV